MNNFSSVSTAIPTHAHKEVVATFDISAGDYVKGASVTKYDDLNNVSTNPRNIHIPQ